MAYLDVYYGRIGSYNGAIKVDNSALENTVMFSSTGWGAYTSHNFIKPVGLFQNMGNNEYNVYVFGVVKNSSANCLQWYQDYSGHSISYGRIVGGFYLTEIQPQYIANINYFNIIPWFNNIDDASNWSCGNPFNPANWVGGLDVRVNYNWQSVPSISGKNGILSLTQIKEEYINDGESVSGASADYFTNLSTENRVDVLIDDALPAPEIGGTTVTIKYTIPSLSTGSYEYCKLVAKKNSMPEGPEDGDKIINIDPTAVSVSVKNLKGHTKYYFVIFVKDSDGNESSSNTKSITTQGAVIPEEYQQYLDLLALTSWGTNSDTTLLTYLNRRGNSSTSVVSSDHSFATRDNFNNNSNCYAFSVLQMSTINISTDPVTVLYTCNVAEYDIIKTSGRDMWGVYSENGNGGAYIVPWGSASGISSPGNTDGLQFEPTTSFNSLEDCLVYLTQHFRHVNVKVDGKYWLKLD